MAGLIKKLLLLVTPRGLLFGLVAVGLLSAQAAPGTLAVFTSTATSTGNTFTAGTLTLVISDANETDLAAVTASISAAAMAPGDVTTGFVDLKSSGSLGLRYAMTTTDTTVAGAANTALSAALTAGVDSRAAGSSCTAAQGGAGQTQVVAAGTVLQTLAIGNPAQGAHTGDRTLSASGGAERLCFYVTLPLSTGNAAQGGSASYTLTFAGEQTNGNP